MATYRKRGDTWRAEVWRFGVRRSETFSSKAEAVAWAGRIEADIVAGKRGVIPPYLTVSDLLDRYEREVSAEKKGHRWEAIRIALFKRDRLALVRLRALDSPHVSDWQTRRLKAVKSASARRERNLLNHAFEVARAEWHWLVRNPFDGVRRPKDGRPRNRLATDAEIAALIAAAGPALANAIVFACETGCRAGEIASAVVAGRIATVDGKTGEREVPLSERALAAWEAGIGLTAGSISTLFADLCEKVGVKGLTFHDLRHYACTRLSKKLDVWQLCKMCGWSDPKIPLRVYYNEEISEIAKRL